MVHDAWAKQYYYILLKIGALGSISPKKMASQLDTLGWIDVIWKHGISNCVWEALSDWVRQRERWQIMKFNTYTCTVSVALWIRHTTTEREVEGSIPVWVATDFSEVWVPGLVWHDRLPSQQLVKWMVTDCPPAWRLALRRGFGKVLYKGVS